MNRNIPWVEKYRPNEFENIVLDPTNKKIFTNILQKKYLTVSLQGVSLSIGVPQILRTIYLKIVLLIAENLNHMKNFTLTLRTCQKMSIKQFK